MRQRLAVVCPQPMANAVNLQRLETFEVQKRQIEFMAGGVAIDNRVKVITNSASYTAVILQRL
jgi:hypothetical protein